jgi:PHD/YefM family antitoxin component YafN of YafNO toxin-antitoxin module
MKTIQISKELQRLLEDAEASEQDTVVFTDNKRPVAALVSLRRVDRESLALSTSPQFRSIIESAREEIRAGRSISLEALERKYGMSVPGVAFRPKAQKRRRRGALVR